MFRVILTRRVPWTTIGVVWGSCPHPHKGGDGQQPALDPHPSGGGPPLGPQEPPRFFYDLSSRRAERPDPRPSRVGERGGVVRANLTLRSRRSSSPRVCPRTRSAGPEPRVWSLPGAHQGVPLRLPGLPRTAGLARVPGHARRRCAGGQPPNIHALHNGTHLMTLRL